MIESGETGGIPKESRLDRHTLSTYLHRTEYIYLYMDIYGNQIKNSLTCQQRREGLVNDARAIDRDPFTVPN